MPKTKWIVEKLDESARRAISLAVSKPKPNKKPKGKTCQLRLINLK